MWETTVRFDVSTVVAAAPERCWDLLRSPEAWSARPGCCLTFDVPAGDAVGAPEAGTGPGRMRFLLEATGGRAYAAPLIITDEVPGESIGLETWHQRATWQLRAESARRGVRLRVTGSRVVLRQSKVDYQTQLRRDHKAWLEQLSAVAGGRAPWPGEGMAGKVRQASSGAPITAAVEASASINVSAPPAVVGRALLGSPAFQRAIQPDAVLYCGYVPDTPAGQVGGLRYLVDRRADGSLRGSVTLVAAAAPEEVIVRRITPPFDETTYHWEPSGNGTALQLTVRCPGTFAGTPDAHRDRHTVALAALNDRIRPAVENLPRDGT